MTVTNLFPVPAGQSRAAEVVELLPVYVDLAERISYTEFVPKALRGRPEAVLAALMSGAERGLGPMESLRSVNVIEGKPTLSAEAMRALVLAAGHEIEIVESTAQRATVRGRRSGAPTVSPEFTWTIDRARRARIAGRDNWAKYPEAMLLARASTDLCRAVFPDVIAGLASAEEIVDDTGEEAPTSRQLAARRRSAQPRHTPELPFPAQEGTPALPTEPAAPADEADAAGSQVLEERPTWGTVADDEPADLPVAREHDPKLAKRIHAEVAKAFPAADAETRDRYRHALVALVTRHRGSGPVTSSADLTYDEQFILSEALVRIQSGQHTLADGPDGTIEVRSGGRWMYAVTLDPLTVLSQEVLPGIDDGGA